MGTCCSVRDPNDIAQGLEIRNDRCFYFNYPKMLEDLDKRLVAINSRGHVHSDEEVSHFKWFQKQLQIQINNNKKNLHLEGLQKFKRRIIVEVCEADGVIRTGGEQSKILVRV